LNNIKEYNYNNKTVYGFSADPCVELSNVSITDNSYFTVNSIDYIDIRFDNVVNDVEIIVAKQIL
jgi:hypothetical protein